MRIAGGTNPWGAQPRPATLTEMGVGHSGMLGEIGPGEPQLALKIELKKIVPQGYSGMAAVHIWAEDKNPLEFADAPNAQLVGEISWESGRGGGTQEIDLTRGHLLMVGGTECINLWVRMRSSILGEELVARATKQIMTTVNWFGNATMPPQLAMPRMDLVDDGEGAFVSPFERIPQGAQSHIAVTTEPELLSGLRAEFGTIDFGDGAVKYATLNPFVNGTPIVLGVEFVRYRSPEGMSVSSVYDLWG